MSAPLSTTGNTSPPALQAPTSTPALQVPSGTPMPQTSGTSTQTQGGSSSTTGSSISAKPFIPTKFDLPMLDNDGVMVRPPCQIELGILGFGDLG